MRFSERVSSEPIAGGDLAEFVVELAGDGAQHGFFVRRLIFARMLRCWESASIRAKSWRLARIR